MKYQMFLLASLVGALAIAAPAAARPDGGDGAPPPAPASSAVIATTSAAAASAEVVMVTPATTTDATFDGNDTVGDTCQIVVYTIGDAYTIPVGPGHPRPNPDDDGVAATNLSECKNGVKTAGAKWFLSVECVGGPHDGLNVDSVPESQVGAWIKKNGCDSGILGHYTK